ncbi:MAG: signal recognition particle subunit SRP19/SEC65 family protein [Candidatus Bathyarchaeia archaeon]
MRKQEKAIIWPAYFDADKTRKEGRRIPKSLAVQSPKIQEIQEAAAKLRLEHEVVADKGFPKTPWLKTGMLLVEKQGSKEQAINRIARQLLKARGETMKQEQR